MQILAIFPPHAPPSYEDLFVSFFRILIFLERRMHPRPYNLGATCSEIKHFTYASKSNNEVWRLFTAMFSCHPCWPARTADHVPGQHPPTMHVLPGSRARNGENQAIDVGDP